MEWVNLTGVSLLLVLIGIVIIGAVAARWYRKMMQIDRSFVERVRNYQTRKYERWIQPGLLIVSVLLVGIGVWGPGWGVKLDQNEVLGVDVLFVVDVSKSMMAEDLSQRGEVQDRLTAAKNMIGNYVEEHPENRYGLVIFAGEAFVSSPLTLDTAAFMTFVQTVSYADVGEQGTDLVEAVGLGLDRFTQQDDRGKVLVLMSDGGDEMGVNLDEMAARANQLGVSIVAVGIGNDRGVPIPEGKDMFGRSVYKTYQGEQVLTKLNEAPLKELADVTSGQYFRAESATDLNKLEATLDRMEKTSMADSVTSQVENQYQVFVWSGLLFLAGVVVWPLLRTRRGR